MTTQVGNPFPMFYDLRGRPLDRGRVYIGAVGEDPETSPIDVFADLDLMDAVSQPISTIGGLLTRQGQPIFAFVVEEQFSIRVTDADGATVYYSATANVSAANFQPLNAGLSAIANLDTTDYGLSLLTSISPENLRARANIPDALPLEGGTMTGNIKRSGAGGFAYAADPGIDRVRLLFTENGAPDPREQPGDIWFEATE